MNYLKEMGSKDVDWIVLAEDIIKWLALAERR
jgi:hypothetical protein